MEISGRKALVLGAGRSGVESARFLAERSAVVALHDRKPLEFWSETAKELKTTHNVGLISGDLPSWLLDQIDLVIISPGVPTCSIPARYVDRKDGEVIGEVELAYRFLKGRVVGITGSNGKTTTTSLVGRILVDAGLRTQVGGNIGVPLLSLVGSSAEDMWNVVELSSFQLETIKTFRPHVGICLNVTPNHLDRYDSFQDYAAAKHRLFMNQTADDVAILNADDEITSSWANGLKATVKMFSSRTELQDGLYLRGEKLAMRVDGQETELTDRSRLFLKGLHNVENALAAMAAGIACGVSLESMRETVEEFKGVEHRLEFVAEVDGVKFYNDSKATSVDAAVKALEAIGTDEARIILILGGRGKNAPYQPLVPLIRRSVKCVLLIGEDADNIDQQLHDHVTCYRVGSLDEAVMRGRELAGYGDIVLLAPACASFDMFSSFEERGSVFKAAVHDLTIQREVNAA
jgi:UDP-N-acetylmuramoylalanine--D-glutamate ligase